MGDVLNKLPGVTITADNPPVTVNKQGGAAMMQNILLAHADVDVVLGADTVVLGALEAARAAGKARDDQFFGGIDGANALAVQSDGRVVVAGSSYSVSGSLPLGQSRLAVARLTASGAPDASFGVAGEVVAPEGDKPW
jgi:ABC-type sugar transport system substrate-binding protein